MNVSKFAWGVFVAAMIAITAVLVLKSRLQDIQRQVFQQQLQDLRVQRGQLAAKTAVAIAPVRETGFYRAEFNPAPGLRRMVSAKSETDAAPQTIYVALLPDLLPEDLAGVAKIPEGLAIWLNPSGQRRLQALTRGRTAGGRVGHEAILVDGEVVATPAFRQEMRLKSFMLTGRDKGLDHAAWADRLNREIIDHSAPSP